MKIWIQAKLLIIKCSGKTLNQCFQIKVSLEKVSLVNNDEILSDSQTIADVFIKFFSNIVEELNLAINEEYPSQTDHISNPVLTLRWVCFST